MRKFRKNPAVRVVVLPTHGRVYDYDILEGDEYAQYCPTQLIEIESPEEVAEVAEVASTIEAPLLPPPVALEVTGSEDSGTTEVVDSPAVEVPATIEGGDAPVLKRRRGRPKKAH